MNNNTIMPNEADSTGHKRKRSLKENEGKASQKKTLWSYFHSLKDGPENLNGTDVKPEIAVSEGQTSEKKSNENGELQEGNMEIVAEKTEPKKNSQEISQSAFELKSPITGPENLNETEVKSETSSENPISALTLVVKASETEEPQDNVKRIDEMKDSEPKKTNQESFQMASTSAINNEGSENLNETEVKPEISINESQASTSQEKSSENESPEAIVKSVDDNKEQEETNQESLQIDSAVNGAEDVNKAKIKPGTSSESQASASMSGEKSSENEGNTDSVESVDEMEEPEETSHESSHEETSHESSHEETSHESSQEETSQESSQETTKLKPFADWRTSCYSVTCLLKKARKEGLFTDIQFVMGEGDMKREFHAHKSILACASPVFEKMFFGPLPEEKSIIETDDDPELFEMLLDYMYGTSKYIHTDSLVTICKFSMIGNKYLVPGVRNAIKTCMFTINITESDFWDVFKVSNFNSLLPLFSDKLDSYIRENAKELVPSEKFLNVPETIVNSILQMDKLNIEEYPLLKAVTKWVYHNKKNVTSKILMNYYKHIRFSAMQSYHIILFIDSYPEALDAETYLKIVQHIHSPSQNALPNWCATSKISRLKELEDSKHGSRCSCYRCRDRYYY